MKPSKSILDRSFIYVPSAATNVDQTWRRFGWRPTNEDAQMHEAHAGSLNRTNEAAALRQ